MKKLGIDYGTKKVGIAISDESATIAFPKEVIPNTPKLVAEIAALCDHESIDTIVLGESKNFQGQENPVMMYITQCKEALEEACGVPVELEPEFLTSQEAMRQSKEGTHDARAAALILQRYLDRHTA